MTRRTKIALTAGLTLGAITLVVGMGLAAVTHAPVLLLGVLVAGGWLGCCVAEGVVRIWSTDEDLADDLA